MSILNRVEIAGICGKFARPENQKEGLHLLAEMASEAQDLKNKAEYEQKVKEIFEEIEKESYTENIPWGKGVLVKVRVINADKFEALKDRKEGEDV